MSATNNGGDSERSSGPRVCDRAGVPVHSDWFWAVAYFCDWMDESTMREDQKCVRATADEELWRTEAGNLQNSEVPTTFMTSRLLALL